jgi:hypothetical protein
MWETSRPNCSSSGLGCWLRWHLLEMRGVLSCMAGMSVHLVVHFVSVLVLRVSDVITESYGRYGFRSVLRMACYETPAWGVNKNKEKNRQEREYSPCPFFGYKKSLKAGRPFNDRGGPSNSYTADHTRNRHWTTLLGSDLAAIAGWSLEMLKSGASSKSHHKRQSLQYEALWLRHQCRACAWVLPAWKKHPIQSQRPPI